MHLAIDLFTSIYSGGGKYQICDKAFYLNLNDTNNNITHRKDYIDEILLAYIFKLR